MRVLFAETLLNSFITANPQFSTHAELSKRSFARVSRYLNTYFKVNTFEGITIGPFSCANKIFSGISGAYDLFVIINPEYSADAGYFAAATSCLDDAADSRPVLGMYFLNFAYMETSKRSEFSYFHIFLHEMFHIMGFSPNYYTKFRKPNNGGFYSELEAVGSVRIGSATFTELRYPELVSLARAHFGCSSLTGVPLENGGGSGSSSAHWEKIFLPDEVMNPTTEENPKVSDFTLTLLRASGWYTISSGAAEAYDRGRAAGCGLFSLCPAASIRGYCSASTAGRPSCSYDYKTKSTCGTMSTMTDGCYFVRDSSYVCEMLFEFEPLTKDATETYGPSSRCIEWKSTANTITPKCHKTECVNGNTLKIVLADTTEFSCTSLGQTISIDSQQSITCPDPLDFCSKFAQRCAEDCYMNGAGMCMKDNSCFCFLGTDPATGKCKVDPAFVSQTPSTDTTNQTPPQPSTQDSPQQTPTSPESPTTSTPTSSPSTSPTTTQEKPSAQPNTTSSTNATEGKSSLGLTLMIDIALVSLFTTLQSL